MRKKLLSSFLSILIAVTIFLGTSIPVKAASKYHVWINYTENVVLIYENDTHIKTFLCSTGKATPTSGTYSLSTKYRWGLLKGGVWGQYCTIITGSIWFHCVPYCSKDPSDLEYWEYDKLGTACSAGCVRLCVEDAKWIYENCPAGTPATFYGGSDIGSLPKPTGMKISDAPSSYRGWDPTDPNSDNPWNSDEYTKYTFDADQYLKYNPELKDTVGTDPLKLKVHWITTGIKEGLRASDEFDISFFKQYYSEFASSYGDDNYSYVSYYNRTGKSAGYFGSEKAPGFKYVFDPVYYANEYPDVKKAFGTDADKLWKHYITNGVRENRSGSAVFNLNYYKTNNKDLKNAFGDNTYSYFRHFINNGMREGRQAIDTFNVFTYMDANPDLKSKFGTDYKKYYTQYLGLDTSSSTTTPTPEPTTDPDTSGIVGTTIYNGVDYSKVYDFTFYEEHNPDVKKAFGTDDVAALRHFVTNGMKEGRQAISTFDVMCYKSLNADLRNAFGDDLVSYYLHYMNQGYKEGRTCVGEVAPEGPVTVYNGVDYSKVYDYDYYIEHNPDVKKAFGSDSAACLKHFVLHGMAEGRQAIATFNVSVYKDLNKDLSKAFGDDLAKYYMHYITQGYKEGRTCA